MAKIVHMFYDSVLGDPVLGPFFENIDMARLKKHQVRRRLTPTACRLALSSCSLGSCSRVLDQAAGAAVFTAGMFAHATLLLIPPP